MSINILKPKSKDDVLDQLKKSNKSMNEILIKSAENGFLLGVKYALENGADVHVKDDDALRWSSYSGHYDVVKLLLDNGADVHANKDQALRWAANNGHYNIVKLLLDNGANVYAINNYTLENLSEDIVKLLESYKK